MYCRHHHAPLIPTCNVQGPALVPHPIQCSPVPRLFLRRPPFAPCHKTFKYMIGEHQASKSVIAVARRHPHKNSNFLTGASTSALWPTDCRTPPALINLHIVSPDRSPEPSDQRARTRSCPTDQMLVRGIRARFIVTQAIGYICVFRSVPVTHISAHPNFRGRPSTFPTTTVHDAVHWCLNPSRQR